MATTLPYLETWGLRYLQRRSASRPCGELLDPVHILNPDEQAALRRIERATVVRAAIAGALSAGASATTELVARSWSPDASMTYHGVLWVIAVTLLATAMEVAFLYWDALRAVHDLARAAGVDLFPAGSSTASATASALARAALELPNRHDPDLGVDPQREASRLGLVLAAVLYKLKIGLTNFVLKLVIGRLGGRTLARAWLPFIAVPVTALWNAWVARTVIHEARIRAIGPSAARGRVDALLAPGRPPLSSRGRVAALRAVGCAVVGKRDLHPNLAALLTMVRERVGICAEPIDERRALLEDLPALPDDERELVLALLAFALILDGRITKRELRLWYYAQTACGLAPDKRPLCALRKAFVSGESLAA